MQETEEEEEDNDGPAPSRFDLFNTDHAPTQKQKTITWKPRAAVNTKCSLSTWGGGVRGSFGFIAASDYFIFMGRPLY